MRPLVKSAVFRMRTAPQLKETIEERSRKMELTQTAYIEMLVIRDAKKEDDEDHSYDEGKRLT